MKLKIQLYKCFHLNVTSFWFGLRVSAEPSKLQASAWHRILLQYSGTESYRTSSDKHMSVVTHLLIIFFVYLYCKAYIVTEYRILKKQTHLSTIYLLLLVLHVLATLRYVFSFQTFRLSLYKQNTCSCVFWTNKCHVVAYLRHRQDHLSPHKDVCHAKNLCILTHNVVKLFMKSYLNFHENQKYLKLINVPLRLFRSLEYIQNLK